VVKKEEESSKMSFIDFGDPLAAFTAQIAERADHLVCSFKKDAIRVDKYQITLLVIFSKYGNGACMNEGETLTHSLTSALYIIILS
jgi:hypothetical protein